MNIKPIFKDKIVLLSTIIIIITAILGIFAEYFSPNNPTQVDLSKKLLSPSKGYLFGTDHLGRCILSRVIYGIRISFSISFSILIIILILGIFAGILAGYYGGIIDSFIMRLIDIILSVPELILAVALLGVLGPSIINLMIAIVAVKWISYARITRSLVLSIKEQEFILAIKALGGTNFRLITKHILPNVLPQIIVLATLDMGGLILRISGLSFLGLGIQPPTPEWGAMLNDGRPYMQVAPWTMIFPGMCILIVVMAFNLLGDSLRDIMDKK